MENEQHQLDLIFGALADPTRRGILARLAQGDATVMELARPFDMSLPAVSKHLKVLDRAGLIQRHRQAQWLYCRLESAPLDLARGWIDAHRQIWEESLSTLDDWLMEMQQPEEANSGLTLTEEGHERT